MIDEYKRIRIIGCSGSGKTYLSKSLSSKYNIISYDLDDIVWDNCSYYGIKKSYEARNNLLSGILKNNSWIIEGVYYKKWVKQTFDYADVIFVLNTPVHICCYRVFKRFLKRKFGLEKGKKETFKSLISLMFYIYQYNIRELPKIRELLKEYSDKVVYIKNSFQNL